MKITIETIPHDSQRYETPGDWVIHIDPKPIHPSEQISIEIRVSETRNTAINSLLILHELTEALLCYDASVTTKEVDNFDMNWKPHDDITEPGEDERAPYHKQHMTAELVERVVAAHMEIDWHEYGRVLARLYPPDAKKTSHVSIDTPREPA